MINPTEQLHNDLRKDKIINEISFLAEQLHGEFTISNCTNSMGYDWSKITIVYDKTKREKK
tara:strand:- start:6 stop:188 length:183 start_codon:yes stop_codon:yes gene_type:complete